jgi:hypothetical protein
MNCFEKLVKSTVLPNRELKTNVEGLSAYTNIASITITKPPAVPSNMTATAFRQGNNNARVTLNWPVPLCFSFR